MIKQLYREKDEFSLQAYSTHLEFQDKYDPFAWEMLHEIVSDEVEKVIEQKYTKVNKKLNNLTQQYRYSEEIEEKRPQHNFRQRRD